MVVVGLVGRLRDLLLLLLLPHVTAPETLENKGKWVSVWVPEPVPLPLRVRASSNE